MSRYVVQAHLNGKPVNVAFESNIHAAANLAESYHRNTGAVKTWVYDTFKGAVAEEVIPANDDWGLPTRVRKLMFERAA